jgi:hypothetical protein
MNVFGMSSVFSRCALVLTVTASSVACSSSADPNDDLCLPDDADGIIDEPAKQQLTVTDAKFAPAIISTQNSSTVTLTLKNEGTTPHGFVVDCLPTPNSDGCPTQSCFPVEARIDPIDPGDEATVIFETPLVEGIYEFHSGVAEDAELAPGQFIIQ